MSRTGKYTEAKSRLVMSRGWRAEVMDWRGQCFCLGWWKSSGLESGDGHTVTMIKSHWIVHLKMAETVNFVMRISMHFFKGGIVMPGTEWVLHGYELLFGGSILYCARSLQLCPTVCDPMDHSPPGSSVHGILPARILEWVAMPSFRGSSWPSDQTLVFSTLMSLKSPALAGGFLTIHTNYISTWDDEKVLKLVVMVTHSVNIVKDTELYTLNG